MEGSVPSKKNSRILICRGRFPTSIPSAKHKAWKEEQMWKIKKHRPKEPFKKCSFQAMYYAKDKRKADLDNKNTSILDLLKDCEFIVDDNWFIVPKQHSELLGVEPDNPRVIITLEELK